MPYKVVELDNARNDFQDQLNVFESQGWTVAHVVQGFTTVEENVTGGTDTVHWLPRFVLHKAEEKPRSGQVYFQ